MKDLRVPETPSSRVADIVKLVQQYFAAAEAEEEQLFRKRPVASPRELILRIDAAVLDLYDLPAALERELLDLFAGWERDGLPFPFDGYFPGHFKARIHLRDFVAVTSDWAKTNRRRGRLIDRKVDGSISEHESAELEDLQRLADLRTDLLAPIALEPLEQLQALAVTRANA
jgi:hypothetical protein